MRAAFYHWSTSTVFLKDKELEWASKDLNLHYYLIRVASWPIRRHAHFFFADSIGIEPITLVLETNVLPLNYEPILAVGSGFAPLVSPISMEWDYYFSNLQNTKSLITSPYCTQRTFRNDGIKYCKLLDWTSCKSSCGEGRTRTYSLLINSQ